MNAKEFINKYVNHYLNTEELDPPNNPLPDDLDIKTIFSDELDIFNNIFDYGVSNREKMEFALELVKYSNELNMEKLTYKLCAIIAYYLRNLD